MVTRGTARASASAPITTSSGKYVLIVDDDPAYATPLSAALGDLGHETRVARSARGAHDLIALRPPDLVLLELRLPDRDGMDLCAELRRWYRNPLIIVSADDDERRKVQALDLGADDYVTKPFSMPELLARVRVALRHRAALAAIVEPGELRLGDLAIDTAAHSAEVDGTGLALTRKEFDLLALLALNAGHLVPHATILTQVWGSDGGTAQSLRVHVTNVRRKLGEGPARPRIETAPGVGYRLVAPGRSRPRDAAAP